MEHEATVEASALGRRDLTMFASDIHRLLCTCGRALTHRARCRGDLLPTKSGASAAAHCQRWSDGHRPLGVKVKRGRDGTYGSTAKASTTSTVCTNNFLFCRTSVVNTLERGMFATRYKRI